MKGKTHIGIGVVTSMALFDKIPGDYTCISVAAVILGAILPDIDHPKSIVNKYILPFKNKMTKLVLYSCSGGLILWYDYLYKREPILKSIGIIFIIIALSSHRKGLTHSLVGLILFSFVSGYIGNVYNIRNLIYYFMIGYGMHLLCDMLTNRGVPLFYPFKKKNLKFPITYKTNSKIGVKLEELIMVFGLVYIIYKLPILFL